MTVVRAYRPPEELEVFINGKEQSVVDFNPHLSNPYVVQDGESSLDGLDLLLTRGQYQEMGDIKGSVLQARKDHKKLGGMVISTTQLDAPERTKSYADVKLECRMYDGPGWNE